MPRRKKYMSSRGVKFNFTSYIPDILQHMPQEIENGILRASMDIHKEVVQSIRGGSGRVYKVPATNRTYRASRPYQPPATRLGDLRQQYRFEVKGRGWAARGRVGNPLKYSVHLEFGTRKMAIRPHLRKAANKVFKRMPDYFEDIAE